MGKNLIIQVFIGIFLVYLTVSCGGGGGAPPDTENPTNVQVTGGITPGQEISGIVALSASAQDNSGTIQKMEFLVSSPDEVLACTATGPKPSGQTFSCTWDSRQVANGPHSIKAKAYDPAGNFAESTPTNFTVNNVQAPPAPTNVRIISTGDQSVTIAWDPVQGATSYTLYMASQPGVTKANYNALPDGMKHPNVTSPFTHTGLTNGKTYYFVVTASNSAGESPESAEVSATPQETLQITTTSLPDGTAGQDYGPFNLQAVGGSPPYTWSIASGTEPRPDFLSPTGTLSGLIAVQGQFPLEFEVRDAQNRTDKKSISIIVLSPPPFDSSTENSIPPGEHYYGDFTIRSGDTVTISGGISGGDTTLNITGKLSIEPGGRLIVTDCSKLLLNLLSKTQNPEILGEVSNRCSPPETPGKDLIIRTIGSLYLGGSDGQPQGSISSSGMLFIGDPWYRPRPGQEVLTYVVTEEPSSIPPVCALKADTLSSGTPPSFPINVNFSAIHKDPDGGATTITEIDYGDTTVEQNPTTLQHSYISGGIYEVILTVKDEENDECKATLMLNLRPPDDPEAPSEVNASSGPPSLWVGVEPFVADELIKPAGVPFNFTSQRYPVPSTAAYETSEWTYTCPSDNEVCATSQSFTTEGSSSTLLMGEDSAGHQSVASLRVYVPLLGGQRAYSDPPAPSQPFPPLPPSYQPAGFPEPQSHTGTCPDCALCADPSISGQPVAVLGSTQLKTWWQGGLLVIGFSVATVVVNPTLVFSSTPGANGVAAGEDGKSALGFGVATYSGKIVMCGGTFIGANGGNGAPNTPAVGVCNGTVRGGNGAAFFGVLLTAPTGSISFCGQLNVSGGNGGNGGNAINDASLIPTPACANGCGSVAIGGKGGRGGGGIAYTAPPGQVCYDAGYSVNFDPGGGTWTGGAGGNATATGGTPPPCPNCNTYAGRGGRARATAGSGGWSAWYFVTNPGNGPSGLGDPRFTGHIFSSGIYNGGAGGNATATAGDGGDSICNGCNQFAWAGWGGNARAEGGKGGFGLSAIGAGGNADATSGSGGNATATPNPAKRPDGCPGGKGCDLRAFGGDSGFATARPGTPNGAVTLVSGVGGNANATGGDGGNGLPCCDGGGGGKAYARGGRDFQGAPFRVDGNATATGGNGGNGGDCDKFNKGGDGGNGADARCDAGPFGVYNATGGNAGNGGAGCPPGSKGNPGGASGVIFGNANPGKPGSDGADLCWLWIYQWPYWSWIPEFDGIPPWWNFTLPIYSEAGGDPPTGQKIGDIPGKFQNDTEFGVGGPVSYQKTSDGWVYLKPGAIELDLSGTNTYSVTVKQEDLTPNASGGPGNGANTLTAYDANGNQLDFTANWGGTARSELTVRSTQPIDKIVLRCHFICRFWHWWILLIHDPEIQKPTQVNITVPPTARAGEPIPVEIVTMDLSGQPTHFSFFDVFVEVSGTRSGTFTNRFPLTDNGNGTYSGNVTLNASGKYNFSALIHDRSTLEKFHPTDTVTVDIIPTEIVALDLRSSVFGPVESLLRDPFGNPVRFPNPGDIQCTSDTPNLSPGPFQSDGDWRLKSEVEAMDYDVGNFTCTHLPSGAQGSVPVGYPPWRLEYRDPVSGQTGNGYPPGSQFRTQFEIRIPQGMPGWKSASGQLVWPKNSGITFNGCQPTASQFEVFCENPVDAPWNPDLWLVNFVVTFRDTGGVIGTSVPFFANYTTPPVVTGAVESYIGVPDFSLIDENSNVIPYDPTKFGEIFRHFPLTIKPIKTLNMHIYLVEDAATQEEAQADVDAAQAAFNLNALLCNCGFFVTFNPTFTTIPAKDWRKIDKDGDGWDRYDSNGDGDYEDPADNNDAFEAMNLGYFDVNPDTENIYYVPGIRRGLLGVTFSPNSQVVVDNSKDNDNLTLFHEKVHEMDLRKDGEFDVKDSPNDPTNAQGAKDPGNGMNYDDTGPNLTPTQCNELDP